MSEMVTEVCISCGIQFSMPAERQRWLKEKHQSFYCPNGHSMVYRGKSEADKLREEVLAREGTIERLRGDVSYWRNEAQRLERSNRGLRAWITRYKRERESFLQLPEKPARRER